MYEEALPVLYGENIFRLVEVDDMSESRSWDIVPMPGEFFDISLSGVGAAL